VAELSSYTLTVEVNEITFKGFTPNELFGDKADKEKTQIATNALELLLV